MTATNGRRPHWRVFQEAEAKRDAMTIDERLIWARETDPAAHIVTCQHCKMRKVASIDPLRSDVARNTGKHGVNGFAGECKTCQRVWKRASEAKAKAKTGKPSKTPIVTRAPRQIAMPATPAPDLIWAGASIAYSRAAILRVEIVEDKGDLVVTLVTTALEFDRKAGIVHNATYTHEGAEARAILAQLGGPVRVAGLSDEINGLKAEIANLRQSQTAKDSELERQQAATNNAEQRLAALAARLAAAGITIKLDE